MLSQRSPLQADLDYVLERTEAIWRELKGARLFVTGGTGFFGKWLIESFAVANRRFELGATAVILTRNRDAFTEKVPHLSRETCLEYHLGEVSTFEFPEGEFSHVIHAAAGGGASIGRPNEEFVFDNVLNGTRRVLEFTTRAKVRRVLFTSSGGAYGRQPPELTHIPEDARCAPDTTGNSYQALYGEAKRAAESLCAAYGRQYGFEAVIARCFAFVGPHLAMTSNFAIGNFIHNAVNDETIRISGDGTPMRSYLYAADLAVWLWTLLIRGEAFTIYNVGSEHAVSISELAIAVREALAPELSIEVLGKPDLERLPERYVPSTRRAREAFGLEQGIELRDAIRRTAQWYTEVVQGKSSRRINDDEVI